MKIETVELAPGLTVSRIAKGNWQLSARHGAAFDPSQAIDDMRRFVDAGITLFDCADHYVGVEQLIGDFRRRHPDHARRIAISTKLVPDLESLATVSKADIEAIVDTSLARLGVDALDLVQFHWWEYDVPGYLDVLGWLADLRRAGKVRHIGTTNLDTVRLREIVAAGIPLATNQLQWSVFDQRPEHGLADFCRAHGIALLCYGTIAGGFVDERWLGVADPSPPFANRSLIKYRLILEEFGGWGAFQRMLGTLAAIGRKHRVAASSVAIRHVLDRPGASVAIVGARDAARLAATLEPFTFALDAEDHRQIAAQAAEARGPRGDCYALERDHDSAHYKIMWRNQNRSGVPIP
jgi:aryl-alcohol dehydrogenase-like predicted oxidoreductase